MMSYLWIPLLTEIALSAGLLMYAIPTLRRARDSESWPRVQATVIETRVKRGKTSSPHIEYAYTFEGRSYTSKRRSVGLVASVSGNSADTIVAASPKGSTIIAAVNPKDTTYAVLVPGVGSGVWLPIAVGCLIIVIGCFTAFIPVGSVAG